jgi:hypothetical protein
MTGKEKVRFFQTKIDFINSNITKITENARNLRSKIQAAK